MGYCGENIGLIWGLTTKYGVSENVFGIISNNDFPLIAKAYILDYAYINNPKIFFCNKTY